MAKKTTNKRVAKIYQLEIWIIDIEPRIWRRFSVRPYTRLDRLHMVIQNVMGWTNSHLHQFTAGSSRYTSLHPRFDIDDDSQDESEAKLSDLVSKPKDRFVYEYDFGDGWEHMVELAAIEDAKKNVRYPLCLAGERACPPEDCGGPWNYPELLTTMRGPDNEERQELFEWLGGKFDPNAFDLKAVNRRLRRGNRSSSSDWR